MQESDALLTAMGLEQKQEGEGGVRKGGVGERNGVSNSFRCMLEPTRYRGI